MNLLWPTRKYSLVLTVQENIILISTHIFYQKLLLGQTAKLLLIEHAEAVDCVTA